MIRQRTRLGMAMLILTESIFFLMLILAFVYFRDQSLKTAVATLNPSITSIYTVCLLLSSLTLWRAQMSSRMRIWLGMTIVFGLAFLAGQGSEYLRILRSGVTMSQGLFGTTFFTLAGMHGLHVAIGIGLLAAAFKLNSRAFPAIAMFWHFVAVVWMVTFSIVYVWSFA